jgi:hypothetical protein
LTVRVFLVRFAANNAFGISFEVAEGLLGWWSVETYIKSPAQPRSVVAVTASVSFSGACVIDD